MHILKGGTKHYREKWSREKGERGAQGKGIHFLQLAREGLVEIVMFEQKPEGEEGMRQADNQRKNKRALEARASLVCLKKGTGANVAEAE